MRRRRVLQLGLGGIAALGVLPRIGAQRAMAADGHETFVYVSNAGTKDIYVLGMNRETGELTMVEKVPVPGAENTSLVSLPMALAPNKRFIYAQLRSEPYPVSTESMRCSPLQIVQKGRRNLDKRRTAINISGSLSDAFVGNVGNVGNKIGLDK